MTPLSRQTRLLIALAVVSMAVIAAAYLLGPPERAARALVADLSWTWTALYAVASCTIATRRHRDADQRSAWAWITAGCALYLGGQLVWNYYELVRQVRPPYPSLADIGFLGIYPCLLVAITRLVRAQPRRRLEPELVLDAVLVTLMVGGLTYEWLLRPLVAADSELPALLTSVAWSIGGVAVLWLMLVVMLRHTRFALAAAGCVGMGLGLLCVANVIYAVVSLRGTFLPGGPLDLGWDMGFLLIGAAAALSPERAAPLDPSTSAISGEAARLAAVVMGLAGIGAFGVKAALAPGRDVTAAVLVAGSAAIVGARFIYSSRADRRYANLLEDEVANQTRSLMDSLAATAAAERNLRLVMNAVPDAIVVLDRAGHVVDQNEPARVMAAARDRLAGRSVFEFLEGESADVVRKRLAHAFNGDVQRFEVPYLRDDGTRGLAALLYAPVREGGLVTRVLALARDITDLKRTESQLQQAEKLAALGQLVSGVAHEINNPAAIISGFAQTLLLEELKPEHREMAQMIYDEATRIGRITSNLLAFARASGAQRTLVDLNDIVRRTFALRSYHLSTLNIAVTLDLASQDPKVWADSSELQQMLLNLLINAEQALMHGEAARTITVRTTASDADVSLIVADSGPGVAPEIRGKIFDPFFTTKPEGVGTGLGLSICYGIAQEHGGRIWVDSQPGHGAAFHVTLPRDARVEGRAESPTAAAPPATGAVTVLVVDDETALRNALLRFLSRRGIDGAGVADGAEALDVLKHRGFDVIVSDVRMPGMNGREFMERLRHEHPDLIGRLIFSTGDTLAPDTAALLKNAGVPTIAKPFDFAALELVIRQVAAEAARGRPRASA
ncbi:MAG TPA: ATP-binding protein [Gemmatimonadales bacterium]|nr:ATP-binding protein [Gemmatimonadales bacterium]